MDRYPASARIRHARIFPLSIQRRLESVPPAASQLADFSDRAGGRMFSKNINNQSNC